LDHQVARIGNVTRAIRYTRSRVSVILLARSGTLVRGFGIAGARGRDAATAARRV
jgi:hypothetical protein